MNPIKVKTPDVRGPGSRIGWCKVVTGINANRGFQGEMVDADSLIDMLPGDLLLVVKPVGYAKDRTQAALLFQADDQAQGNLKQLHITTEWPASQESVARIAASILSKRQHPDRYAPAKALPPDKIRQFILKTCRAAIRDAVAMGLDPAKLLAALAAAITDETGGDSQVLLLAATRQPGSMTEPKALNATKPTE